MEIYDIAIPLIFFFSVGYVLYSLLLVKTRRQFAKMIRELIEGQEYDLYNLSKKIKSLEKKVNEIMSVLKRKEQK